MAPSRAPAYAVEVARLEAGFGSVRALNGIDLEISAGELVGIAGESGAGKTTLMRCISGDLAPTGGRAKVAAGSRLEVVWQDLALCDNLDIASNLLLGREPRWMVFTQARGHRMAREALEDLDLDLGRTTDVVGDLNDARRQLLAVAKAVSANPNVLLLDEPTAPLGVEDTARVETIVRRLNQQGSTVVLVSHDTEQLFRVTQRIVVIRKGRIAGEVDPSRGHPDDVTALLSGHELESSAHHQLTRLHALTDRLASADPSSSLLMILTALGTALGAERLALHVTDPGGELRLACSLGLPPDLSEPWRTLPPTIDGGPIGMAALTQQPRIDSDVRNGHAWRPFVADAWRARIASSWAVPFTGSDGVAGVITVFRDRIGRPTRDELDLAVLYGGYAAGAIERDRLVGELTSRNLVLETIRDVLETLAGPTPVDEALDMALRSLVRGVGADEAAVFTTLVDGTVACRAHVTDRPGPDLDALVSAHRHDTQADGRVESLVVPEDGWGFAVSFVSRDGVDTLAAVRCEGVASDETRALVEDAAHSVRLALERERAQLAVQETAALRRSQDLQRQFLARLSHELRTPLTAIGGYADSLMLGDVTWDAASHDRFLSRIAAESQRLRRLVDDLLDHSAIESGVLRLQRDWCDLRLLLEAAVACLAPASRAVVRVEVGSDVPTIWADHDRLEQVFLNLLDNAVRHNPYGTQVWASAHTEGAERVVVEVRDDGAGTPDTVAAAPFRLHRDKRGPTAGAGLGLSITHAIVLGHGGTIDLDDARPGTRFLIRLPVSDPDEAPNAAVDPVNVVDTVDTVGADEVVASG